MSSLAMMRAGRVAMSERTVTKNVAIFLLITEAQDLEPRPAMTVAPAAPSGLGPRTPSSSASQKWYAVWGSGDKNVESARTRPLPWTQISAWFGSRTSKAQVELLVLRT